jgi:DNA primase
VGAFGDDQKFMAQTFVAVEPNGLDPCELRQKSGDAAVLDLVASCIPLVEFVLRTTVARFDLDTAEGRVAALDKAIPLVAQVKDRALRDDYARRLAGLVGFGLEDQVLARVRGLERATERRVASAPVATPTSPQQVDEAVVAVEREVLKIALQLPAVAGPEFDSLTPSAFLVAAHQQVRRAIADAGGTPAGRSGPEWPEAVASQLPEPLRPGVHALAVEPLRSPTDAESQARYAALMLARLHEIVAGREILALKSKLQRINPLEAADEHARLFGELIALESYRRNLRERAIGAS